MIDRGELLVRGVRLDGSVGAIDVLDLDETSFRRWVVGKLVEMRAPGLQHIKPGAGQPLLRERKPEIVKPVRQPLKPETEPS
jgi:hypothetical protein